MDKTRLNEKGEEILDDTPIAIPLGFHRPPSLQEQFQMFLRYQSQEAQNRGEETFEEADDFDVGDDYDPTSPYEEHFDHQRNIEELRAQILANRSRKDMLREERPDDVPEKVSKKKKEEKPSQKSDQDEE